MRRQNLSPESFSPPFSAPSRTLIRVFLRQDVPNRVRRGVCINISVKLIYEKH
jgi:hypothetical protein